MALSDFFTGGVESDLKGLMVGNSLGMGASREVFVCAMNEEFVVKFEYKAKSFSNALEWEVWQHVKDTAWAKWFAPCICISNSGNFLVQRRTTPVAMKDMPKEIPSIFTDLKVQNWGRLDGKIVCHDYGLMTRLVHDSLNKRMIKAKWWE